MPAVIDVDVNLRTKIRITLYETRHPLGLLLKGILGLQICRVFIHTELAFRDPFGYERSRSHDLFNH